MYEEINNLDLLIIEWFKHIYFNDKNDTILLLSIGYDFKEKLQIKLNQYFATANYNIKLVESLYGYNIKDNNVIFLTKNKDEKNMIIFDLISKGESFLYIPDDHSFYQNIDSFLDMITLQNSQAVQIQNNERFKYYLETIEPYNMVKYLKNDLNLFVKYRMKILTLLLDSNANNIVINLLANNTTYSYNAKNFRMSLHDDISLLDDKKILTSRLAIFLYRLATFRLNTNITRIGRYFHDKSGNKSKVFNLKSDGVMLPDLKYKSFKAYDLNVNESELAIRKEIAAKLKSLNILDLDIGLISEVTGLSIENVKKSTF